MFSIDAPNEEKLWIFEQIETKYAEIKARIEAAAQRSGRSASDVLLVAVSKYAGSNDGIIEGFLQAGIYDLAENRPQALLAKRNIGIRSNQETLLFPVILSLHADLSKQRQQFIGITLEICSVIKRVGFCRMFL